MNKGHGLYFIVFPLVLGLLSCQLFVVVMGLFKAFTLENVPAISQIYGEVPKSIRPTVWPLLSLIEELIVIFPLATLGAFLTGKLIKRNILYLSIAYGLGVSISIIYLYFKFDIDIFSFYYFGEIAIWFLLYYVALIWFDRKEVVA